MSSLANIYKESFNISNTETLSLEEFLEQAKGDASTYATAAERMLKAIGQPEFVDTSKDERLGRIFQNRIITRYKTFEGFYGMEDTIERIVSFYRHAAQGLEEAHQILYLLGPVGSAKSSLAERLKVLMEQEPIYVLTANGVMCPNFESPMVLFNQENQAHVDLIEGEYEIPRRYMVGVMGPWTQKRLEEFGGDITKFEVTKIQPSKLRQVAIAKTEPAEENNQDISALVGKVDIRKLELYSQDDADAYSYSGALCKANQGLFEFVEMFKAPIKVLNPLLTATQEGNFMGTESLPAIPFQGLVLAHSNESEWGKFKSDKRNEAFLDRIYIVKVPYCLRVTEETEIYSKLLRKSSLAEAPCAPYTLKMLAQFTVLSRITQPKNSTPYSKLRVYDGESLKDVDPRAKSYEDYKESADNHEGMDGLSTRWAYKVLSRVFNYDKEEIAANPVHLMYIVQKAIEEEDLPEDRQIELECFLEDVLKLNYKDIIGKEIQTAYLESYSEYGQNIFDRYISYADAWSEENDYVDPETGERFNRKILDEELSKLEKPAGITNPKGFRADAIAFTLRYQARNNGNNPKWTAYEPLREVIEKRMFSNTEDLLPVISFVSKGSKEEQRKHDDFVKRMEAKGYTKKQVRILVEWYTRVNKSS